MSHGAVFIEEESCLPIVEAVAHKLGIRERIVIIPHEGKSDLENSFPRKIRGWRHPSDLRFLISRDGPESGREHIKDRLARLVPSEATGRTKIRIIVHELETWLLGDPDALVLAKLITPARAASLYNRQFRDLCKLANPVQELHRMIDERGKTRIARKVAPFLNLEKNRAPSFHSFVSALKWTAKI